MPHYQIDMVLRGMLEVTVKPQELHHPADILRQHKADLPDAMTTMSKRWRQHLQALDQ